MTERMVDEVDENKRKLKMYDLRLEPSGECLSQRYGAQASRKTHLAPTGSRPNTNRFQPLEQRKFFRLTEAFVRWGGFASSPSQKTTGPSTTPTLDDLIERGSQFVKAERPTSAVEEETPPLPTEEPLKPFNYEFDEPVRSTETRSSVSSQAGNASSAQPQSLLTMQREGKRLSRKQKALLQAAAISRTPLPNLEEKALAKAKAEETEIKEIETASESRMETDEEKRKFQDKVWNLVKGKWF